MGIVVSNITQRFDALCQNKTANVPVPYVLDQGWATPGTRAELGTRALLFGTRARTRKRDPF